MLPRAVASLRAQTFSDWVCELHNDDPTDPGPANLLASLGDMRFSLVNHAVNLGGTATFNLFFQGTSEPYYSILEDDNWWEPDFLQTMLSTAEAHPDIQVFWANMHIIQEQSDGSFRSTGRTIWPVESQPASRAFAWGQNAQVCGALHSNGAALFRSIPGVQYVIPGVPLASIEPCRERLFPHPIMLVSRPLAAFCQTLQSSRSDDLVEWGEMQAILAATFLATCPWSDERHRQLWTEARGQVPPGTTNLIMAALALPAARRTLKHARWSDWWIALRGFVRRPVLIVRLLNSQRRHPEWWQFLNTHTTERWQQNDGTR